MSMAQQNHDDRGHRQGQQHTSEAEQLAAGEDGEDHGYRVQADDSALVVRVEDGQ